MYVRYKIKTGGRMMNYTIKTIDDFRRWARSQMALQDVTYRELAKRMGISYTRISEALHGKPTGKKHIIPLIMELGGNPNDFKKVI